MGLLLPLQEQNRYGPLVALQPDVVLLNRVQAVERVMVPGPLFCRELFDTKPTGKEVVERRRQATVDTSQ